MYFKETSLYIKTHNATGLKYFGKTISEDVDAYLGSGLVWKRHLEKHTNSMLSETFFKSDNKRKLVAMAVGFSIANNIVKSKDWANLKIENGLDGGWSHIDPKGKIAVKDLDGNTFQTTVDDPRYLSGVLVSANKGVKKSPLSQAHKDSISKATKGENNPMFGIKGSDHQCTDSTFMHKGTKEILAKPAEIWYLVQNGWKLGRHEKSKKSMRNKEKTFKDGTRHPLIKTISIYDNHGRLFGVVTSSFAKYCKENKLPTSQLRNSYKTNSTINPKYEKTKQKYADYLGWSAIERA